MAGWVQTAGQQSANKAATCYMVAALSQADASVIMAGRANSVMNVFFILDAFMGPVTSPGSATVNGTGVACCVIKI